MRKIKNWSKFGNSPLLAAIFLIFKKEKRRKIKSNDILVNEYLGFRRDLFATDTVGTQSH
jgi:hypothetical protein